MNYASITNVELIFQNICSFADDPKVGILGLTKIDCYLLHRYIATNFDDGICEELTWDNDLIFNCETYTHQEMYDKLFKLKFRGVQLGQLD